MNRHRTTNHHPNAAAIAAVGKPAPEATACQGSYTESAGIVRHSPLPSQLGMASAQGVLRPSTRPGPIAREATHTSRWHRQAHHSHAPWLVCPMRQIERALGLSPPYDSQRATHKGQAYPPRQPRWSVPSVMRSGSTMRLLAVGPWSYDRIAARAGVSRATLHRWVHGCGSGNRATRVKLATDHRRPPQPATAPPMLQSTHRST